MSDPVALRKQLKIKTGSVKRILKEYNMYKGEKKAHEKTVADYVAAGAEKYETESKRKLLAESNKMIPEAEKRLGDAVAGLQELVDIAKQTLAGEEELKKAEEALKEVDDGKQTLAGEVEAEKALEEAGKVLIPNEDI